MSGSNGKQPSAGKFQWPEDLVNKFAGAVDFKDSVLNYKPYADTRGAVVAILDHAAQVALDRGDDQLSTLPTPVGAGIKRVLRGRKLEGDVTDPDAWAEAVKAFNDFFMQKRLAIKAVIASH